MIYLTFGDGLSGVYSSQVIDVCRYLSVISGKPVPLVAFISMRNFGENKQKILSQYPDSYVYPMIPKLRNWRLNRWKLGRVVKRLGHQGILCRGPLATMLGLELRKKGIVRKVGFDGRGAYRAEWQEYEVVPDQKLVNEIPALEGQCVLDSDFRLAVSHQLVKYWKAETGYAQQDHVVIPCTLNQDFSLNAPSLEKRISIRERFGFLPDDIILVFSGSSAGWQSFQMLDQFVEVAMQENPRIKLLMLSRIQPEELHAGRTFPDRVRSAWVSHQEVVDILSSGDYGLLLREEKVTNQVASPTKFAEYLAAGLKVVVSGNVGDFPDFVRKHSAGAIHAAIDHTGWTPLIDMDRSRMQNLAKEYFTKEACREHYQALLSNLA